MTLHRFAALRVRSRVSGGSSSPIVVETDGGMFVAKLRGAGHGTRALVAEIIAAELAERLGLPVPERALLELPPHVATDDRNDELADFLAASAGENLGFRFLDGARDAGAPDLRAIGEEFAVRTLWLDGWVMNPDCSAENPNVMLWNRQPWLIDHGAALAFQHAWSRLTEISPREPVDYDRHVFASFAPRLRAHDDALAGLFDRSTLAAAVAEVPDTFALASNPEATATRARATYEAFLWKRLKPPRPFVP